MKNDKLALQLKRLNGSLLERMKEASNIINGIIRDSLMTKDNIGRVRRKLFN